MPSFVNIGARVGEGTMVDTWATVGSCAQIGSNVHISGGAGIGGVLEPLQAGPVIIEDDCFIGARSEVAEGVVVERGSVLSMGVFLGASTKIVDRASGEVHYGRVPAYSVVVPGALPGKDGGPALACAVIVKRVDERTRSKTSINELLQGLDKLSLSPLGRPFVGGDGGRACTCRAMKPVEPSEFERNCADAAGAPDVYGKPVIRTQMNRSDWLILGMLALIWGGAFFFIGVAVRHVPAADLCLAAPDHRRGRDVGVPASSRARSSTCRAQVWGSIVLLALLNNALPFALFGWGQTHIASGLASILNATTPIWGVVVAHFLTHDERMTPRKIAGVLLGFGGVATMIGPSLAVEPRQRARWRSSPASPRR